MWREKNKRKHSVQEAEEQKKSPTDEEGPAVCLDMDHLLMVLLFLWSSGPSADGRRVSREFQCETTMKADIVLLLDQSGSISSRDFGIMKSIVTEIVNSFYIGPDQVQIGVVLYSSNFGTTWHLNTYQTKEALLNAIVNLRQEGGGTMTGRALNYTLHEHFKPDAGMRKDSQKIVVLFTDGESQDDVQLPSDKLKDAGIEVYAIGVGDASDLELLSIVSNPHKTHLYKAEFFSDLSDVVIDLIINLCNGTKVQESQCEITAKADIVLLLDQSGSISSIDFGIMKSIVTKMVNLFYIGPDQVQIGVVLYSSNFGTTWHLNTYQTKEALLNAIVNLRQEGGGTMTGRALNYTLHEHFKPDAGMRKDSQKIVVLFTDGESQDDVQLPSDKLKDAGIEVYAIGVGDASDLELLSIISNPHKTHLYKAEFFSDLSDVVIDLIINLCQSAKVRVPGRLVGGSSHCSGALEVKRGEWKPVTGSDWTLRSAAVVCRALDCGSAVSTGIRDEPWHQSAWEISPDCVQSGFTLSDCVSLGCSYSTIEITCSEFVRLVNGTSQCSGRLEVKSNQTWSSVCGAAFSQQDAEVVCRELGCGAPSVLQGAPYGEAEASRWTSEFQCGGNESSLLDCKSSASPGNTCTPERDVRLTCSEPVRLVEGSGSCAGTLEVKQGVWRRVFVSNWTLTSAAAVCGELNCGTVVSMEMRDEHFNRSVWSGAPRCNHSGAALRECVTLSGPSSTLDITCAGVTSDGAVFLIRLVLHMLTLLLFFTVICCVQKATRGQKAGRREKTEPGYQK